MAIRHSRTGGGAGEGEVSGQDATWVVLSPMRRRHLRQVMRIEALSYPRPWSVGLFMSELALRSSRDYFVAKVGGSVVAYAGMMFQGEEGHITNIAVDPAFRRKHVALALMVQLLRTAWARGIRHLTLEVRMGNQAAQSLYFRFGFAPAGVRKNYYVETGEDALIMWAHDIDSEDYIERIGSLAETVGKSTQWAS